MNDGPHPPKISLLVLSYNQAAFVEDAVKAALAQDCPPIEIILSDDHSTDATFERMQAAASGYDGPHKLVIRQNPQNLGLVAHINALVDLAQGDILIPAYGDDIALPNRVAELSAAFAADAPLLVHSDALAIDAEGVETETRYRKADFYRSTDPLLTATSMSLYLGAAGAWHRDLFTKYGPLRSPLVFDDHILGFRAALEGRIAFVEKPLLKYREGVGLSHQLTRPENTAGAASARRRKILAREAATYRHRLDDAETYGLTGSHPIVKKLRAALRQSELRLACHDGILRMVLSNLSMPGAALTAAGAEGLRILRKR